MSWFDEPVQGSRGAAALSVAKVNAAGDIAAKRERGASLVEAANIDSATKEDAAARSAGDIRGTGLLTKHRPVGGWPDAGVAGGGGGVRQPGGGGGGGVNLADAATLGEASSYRGGAGAPAPVQVIRGMRPTYATDAGGTNLSEFNTPQQAGQAWNRNQVNLATAAANEKGLTDPTIAARFGTFRPQGQSLLESQTAAAKEINAAKPQNPAQVATADIAKQNQDRIDAKNWETGFDSHFASNRGVNTIKKSGIGFDSNLSNLSPEQMQDAVDSKVAGRQVWNETKNPEAANKAGLDRYDQIQMARQWFATQPLPANYDVSAKIRELQSNPEHWQKLMQQVNAAGLHPGQPVVNQSTSSDPGLNNLSNFGKNFYQGGVETGEMMGRAARQVIPGASFVFNDKGTVKDFLPLNKDVPYNPYPFVQ